MGHDNFLGVFGHVNIDHIMPVDALPKPNTSIEIKGMETRFGGTGANIALRAAALGVKTALASFVGPDLPDEFNAMLMDHGVDITDLARVSGERTPTCRILTDPEGNQMGIMDQGAMSRMEELPVAEHTVRYSQVIHVGTGRPGHYRRVMALAGELGKPVYFDPAQELHYLYAPETFRDMLAMSHALFGNRSELDTAMRYLGANSPEQVLEHVSLLVITMGSQGSRIFTGRETLDIPAIAPERYLEPTGAGDAYRAGFYAGLARGMDLESCGLLGAASASFALECAGPLSTDLPGWDAVLERAGL